MTLKFDGAKLGQMLSDRGIRSKVFNYWLGKQLLDISDEHLKRIIKGTRNPEYPELLAKLCGLYFSCSPKMFLIEEQKEEVKNETG